MQCFCSCPGLTGSRKKVCFHFCRKEWELLEPWTEEKESNDHKWQSNQQKFRSSLVMLCICRNQSLKLEELESVCAPTLTKKVKSRPLKAKFLENFLFLRKTPWTMRNSPSHCRNQMLETCFQILVRNQNKWLMCWFLVSCFSWVE